MRYFLYKNISFTFRKKKKSPVKQALIVPNNYCKLGCFTNSFLNKMKESTVVLSMHFYLLFITGSNSDISWSFLFLIRYIVFRSFLPNYYEFPFQSSLDLHNAQSGAGM